MDFLSKLLALIISFSQGMAVSAAVAVFISVLGIAPQLASVTGTRKYIRGYAYALGAGIVLFAALQLIELRLPRNFYGVYFEAIVLWFWGMFTGVLLSALAEVFDIFPAFTSKLGLQKTVKILVITLALGKTIGSFIFWFTGIFR